MIKENEFYETVIGILKNNFPYHITGWIDLYSIANVPNATTATWSNILTYRFLNMNTGVIKWFGCGFTVGNPVTLIYQVRLNNVLIPTPNNTTYQSQIAYQMDNLDYRHIDIKNNDVLTVDFNYQNGTAAPDAIVWTRCKGWYY